jgi:hypothetical protein
MHERHLLGQDRYSNHEPDERRSCKCILSFRYHDTNSLQFLVFDGSAPSTKEYFVEGTTFSPYGSVKSADGKVVTESASEPLERLAQICAICNDSKIVYHAVCPVILRVVQHTHPLLAGQGRLF